MMAQEPAPQQSTTGPVAPPSAGPRLLSPIGVGSNRLMGTFTMAGVPPYLWRHGCGPTAVGMVLGYYDSNGFPDLFDGDASTQTANVSQGIASQGSGTRGSGTQLHYEDYVLPNDSSSGSVIADSSATYPTGCHTNNSIADFMRTSWSSAGNFYGWTWSSDIIPAFTNYVLLRSRRYVPRSTQYYYGSTLTWAVLTNEVANNRPMVFLVDSTGDGSTDHFVPIIGYADGPPQQYACYDTWGTSVRWSQFRGMSNTYSWGVWGGWSFSMATNTPPVAQAVFAKHAATNGSGFVTLSNKLSDVDLDACQIQVSFSTNAGATWTNAWIQSVSATYGSVTISNLAERQIIKAATGSGSTPITNSLSIVWNSTNNLPGSISPNTLVRFQAWDGTNYSDAVTSSPFFVDNEAPAAPAAVGSSTHVVSLWTNRTTIAAYWTAAADGAGSGVRGYACTFTNIIAPAAGTNVITSATNTTSATLADGTNWWVAVRSVDSNGNKSASVSIGPFLIDSTGPVFTNWTRTSPTNLTVAFVGAVAVTVQVSDATSGVSTNVPQFDFHFGGGYTGWKTMTNAGGALWTRGGITTNWLTMGGTTLRYKVQCRDLAGNVTQSVEQTEFIDPISCTLRVVTAHGTAAPSGNVTTNYGFWLNASIGATDQSGGTQFICRGWAIAGNEPQSGLTNSLSLQLTNNAVLTWLWPVTNFLLTTTSGVNGAIGTPKPDGWYAAGSNAIVRPTASNYFHFDAWTGNIPAPQIHDNPLTILMDQQRTLTAAFAADLAPLQTPEWWLAAHGLTNGAWSSIETNDSDHDGVPNWQEWIADTDPTNAASRLGFTILQPAGAGLRINWKGGTNAWQYIERADTPGSATWTTIYTNPPPTSAATNLIIQPDAAPAAHYRLRVTR